MFYCGVVSAKRFHRRGLVYGEGFIGLPFATSGLLRFKKDKQTYVNARGIQQVWRYILVMWALPTSCTIQKNSQP